MTQRILANYGNQYVSLIACSGNLLPSETLVPDFELIDAGEPFLRSEAPSEDASIAIVVNQLPQNSLRQFNHP